MSERAPYSRVYWSVVDDPKFAAIYDDDRHLATWLRLLLVADQAHPASANVPTGTNRRSVLALAECGLIDLGTGSRYRVHGLDAERERRRQAATRTPPGGKRPPSATHPDPKPDADGPSTTGLRRDEGETSKAEQDARADGHDPWADPEHEAVQWLAKHGVVIHPNSGYYPHLVTMVEAHGINAVVGMLDRLAAAGTKNGDVKGFLFGGRDALDKQSRPSLAALDKDDRDGERDKAHRRELERTQKYLADLRAVGGDS